MSRKVLFVATVLRMHVLVFHLPYMRWFQEQGYEVHLCCANDTPDPHPQVPYCDRWVELPFSRSPFSADNREGLSPPEAAHRRRGLRPHPLQHAGGRAVGPSGGACGAQTRHACGLYGARVSFFTGAPLKNWLLYYPAERLLSRWTDLLITINGEDYARAKRFAAGRVALVSGVGVDLARFRGPVDRAAVRVGLGIGPEDAVLITVGEHSERKNHETVIAAAAPIEGAHVLFCGVGDRQAALEKQARELDMEDRVHFLGFRKDIPALLAASDVFVFPSLQEGLPVAQMEAMAAGLPCVVSDVRGNNDLIAPGEGGFLRAPRDVSGFTQDIARLLADPALRARMGERNRREMRRYSLEAVLAQMTALLPRPAGWARAMTEGGCGCGVGAVSDALSAGEGR